MPRASPTTPQVGPRLQGLASSSRACEHETVSTPRETEVCAMTIIRTVPEVEATGDVAAIYAEDQLAAIARDYTDAGLTAAEVEMMRFAERVAVGASAMTDADALRLRDVGFSDREIVDITITASARLYLGSALQALTADVDVPERLSEQLRSALVEGL
jgi:hypothetical protein